jgi:protein-S-isoprenylcysteine O-methyltransferase Ste14
VKEVQGEPLAIARGILSYLVKNPEAKDTIEGIVRFWLVRERMDLTEAEVAAGLRYLVDRGLVREKIGAGGRPYFECAGRGVTETRSAIEDLRQRLNGAPRSADQFPPTSQIGNLLSAGVLLAACLVNFPAWIPAGRPIAAAFMAWNALVAFYLLIRLPAMRVTAGRLNWLAASAVPLLLLGLRPVPEPTPGLAGIFVGLAQLAGLAGMFASTLTLRRMMGIVAADRGVAARGPYAWVRHPWYASEILFALGLCGAHPSVANVALLVGVVLGDGLRARQEETLLEGNPQYQDYRAGVPRRFIPTAGPFGRRLRD